MCVYMCVSDGAACWKRGGSSDSHHHQVCQDCVQQAEVSHLLHISKEINLQYVMCSSEMCICGVRLMAEFKLTHVCPHYFAHSLNLQYYWSSPPIVLPVVGSRWKKTHCWCCQWRIFSMEWNQPQLWSSDEGEGLLLYYTVTLFHSWLPISLSHLPYIPPSLSNAVPRQLGAQHAVESQLTLDGNHWRQGCGQVLAIQYEQRSHFSGSQWTDSRLQVGSPECSSWHAK